MIAFLYTRRGVTVDVTIVGAGLGGLAAAVAAHRAGHAVTVFERATELREKGAGIGLLPNAVLALDQLGLGAVVRDRAAPPGSSNGLRDRHGHRLIAADQSQLVARIGAPWVVVPRPWLHRLLVSALPDGAVLTGAAIDDVTTI